MKAAGSIKQVRRIRKSRGRHRAVEDASREPTAYCPSSTLQNITIKYMLKSVCYLKKRSYAVLSHKNKVQETIR